MEFERAYKNSAVYEEALNEIKDYEREIDNDVSSIFLFVCLVFFSSHISQKPSQDFIKTVERAKANGAKKHSKYMVSLWSQVHAMIARQMHLIRENKFELLFKYVNLLLYY